ncbi:MAG TPA: hypothetical protein VMV80_04210 [Anaerolineales bacterium]|nr:hypothetical protein [Anaerolineales bacterium]
MWFDGAYYWRGRYCPIAQELKFEYIALENLESNVWIENVNAAIDASGFTGMDADFTVRGSQGVIPTTIHYSDGEDTWIAESDEASILGWAWQNITKVFDATVPDTYRNVNLAADRKPVNPKLWACAVFVDASEGKQWVKTRRQSSSGDIIGWDAAVDVSNVNNVNTIHGCSIRSMGASGSTADDMMWVYKEDIALRSRYYTGAVWRAIQDIDVTTYPGEAKWDFEHAETAGIDMGHVVYIDADESVQWRERDAGATEVWSASEQLHGAIHPHFGVGIVEHGTGWLWVIWVDDVVIEGRLHLCTPETWYPLLAAAPLVWDTSTEAIINTSTVEQPQTPDSVPAGFPVPMVWVGETTPTNPCLIAWGVLRAKAYEVLFSKFIVRQESSIDLYSEFIVRHSAKADFHAFFHVGQASKQLFAEFTVRQPASLDLFAKFVPRHSAERNLRVFFHVGQNSESLKALALLNGIGYIVKGAYVF